MNNEKRLHIILLLSFCFTLLFPIHPVTASEKPKEDTATFLAWYEANKNNSYEEYQLRGDLYLDDGTLNDPIRLDGTGFNTINCNGYSIYIRGHVLIDNSELLITSSWNATAPILVVENKDASSSAKLSLKNGYIAGNTTALEVRSGKLECPSGTDFFEFVGNPTAIHIIPDDIVLQNLIVTAESERDIIAIKATSNIQLINCDIKANVPFDSPALPTIIAVQAGNTIHLQNTKITAKGEHAKSVVSLAGVEHINMDINSEVFPALDLPAVNNERYRIKKVHNPQQVNVLMNMPIEQINLPTTIRCELEYLDGRDEVVEDVELSVTWDTKLFSSYVNSQGEFELTGSFSKDQLKEKSIYQENSYQPIYQFATNPITIMNYIRFSTINETAEVPYVKAYLFRPYGAKQVTLQYSRDGITWVDGYCIREVDQQKDFNVLTYAENLYPKIFTTVYFPTMQSGGYIRSVVVGGPFKGTWEPVEVIDDNLFTPPGEDGSGGNRGGGGQTESNRTLPIPEEESATSTLSEEVIPTPPNAFDSNTLPQETVKHDVLPQTTINQTSTLPVNYGLLGLGIGSVLAIGIMIRWKYNQNSKA